MNKVSLNYLLLILTSTRRELQAHVWVPTGQKGKPPTGRQAIVVLLKGRVDSISGRGARLAKVDSDAIAASMAQRAPLIDLALVHLVNRVMRRGKFGPMPFRPYRLEIGDGLISPMAANPEVKLVLRPIARNLESVILIMPAGSDKLLISQLWGVQIHGVLGVVLGDGSDFDPPKPPAQVLPLLRKRWHAQTPSGAPMADAFVSIIEELGPGLRHSISELIAAFN